MDGILGLLGLQITSQGLGLWNNTFKLSSGRSARVGRDGCAGCDDVGLDAVVQCGADAGEIGQALVPRCTRCSGLRFRLGSRTALRTGSIAEGSHRNRDFDRDEKGKSAALFLHRKFVPLSALIRSIKFCMVEFWA